MRGILNSEWIKFYSSPLCVIGSIGTVLIAPVILLIMGANKVDISDVFTQSIRAFACSQAGIAVVAAGFFGQEYEQSCLRTTFLSTPSRIKVIAAKAIVLIGITVLASIVSGLLCVAVGAIQHDSTLTFRLVSEFMIRIAIATISWIQIALISAGLAMITKTQVTPIAVIVPLVLGLSQLLFMVSKLARFLPDLATMNLFLSSNSSAFLDTLSGVFVQFTWVLLFGVPAIWLTLHRDIYS